MNKVCMPCSATWLRPGCYRAELNSQPAASVTVGNICGIKIAFTKANVFWSSAQLIKFDVWIHCRSCRDKFIRGRNIRSTKFGLGWIPTEVRSRARFQTALLYFSIKLASLIHLNHVNKTSSFYLVHLIDPFSIKNKIKTHAKIYRKWPVSFRIFAD